jgi:hypothetical protein
VMSSSVSETRRCLNVSIADYTAARTAGILNCFHLVIAFTTHPASHLRDFPTQPTHLRARQ